MATINAYTSPYHLPGIDLDYRPPGFLGPYSAQITSTPEGCTVKVSVTSDTRFLKGYKYMRARLIDLLHRNCEARASDFYTLDFSWRINNPNPPDGNVQEASRPYELMVTVETPDACNILDMSIMGSVQGTLGWSTPIGEGDCSTSKSDAFPWKDDPYYFYSETMLPGELAILYYNINETLLSFVAGWSAFHTRAFTGGWVVGSTGGGMTLRWIVWCECTFISVVPTDFYSYTIGNWYFLLREEGGEVFSSGTDYEDFVVTEPGDPDFNPPPNPGTGTISVYRLLPMEVIALDGIHYGNTVDPSHTFDNPSNFESMVNTQVRKGTIVEVDYERDQATVDITGLGTHYEVPIYYHCAADITVEGGSSAFTIGDEVVIVDVDEDYTIVGFTAGLMYCECSFILKIDFIGFGCYFWDVMNDVQYELLSDGNPVSQPVTQAWVNSQLRQGRIEDTDPYEPRQLMITNAHNISYTPGDDGEYTWSAQHFSSIDRTTKTRTNRHDTVSCWWSPWLLDDQMFAAQWYNPAFLDLSQFVYLDYYMPHDMDEYNTALGASGAASLIYPWADGLENPIGSWTSIYREDEGVDECGWDIGYVLYIPCHTITRYYLTCDRTLFGTDLYSYQVFIIRDMSSMANPWATAGFRRFPYQTMQEIVEGHLSLQEPYTKNYSFVNDNGSYPVKGFILIVPQYVATRTTDYWLDYEAIQIEMSNFDSSVNLFGTYEEVPPWTSPGNDPPEGYHRNWSYSHTESDGVTVNPLPSLHDEYGFLSEFKVVQGFSNKAQFIHDGYSEEDAAYRYSRSEYRIDCPNLRTFLEKLLNEDFRIQRFTDFHPMRFQFYAGPSRGLVFGAPPEET